MCACVRVCERERGERTTEKESSFYFQCLEHRFVGISFPSNVTRPDEEKPFITSANASGPKRLLAVFVHKQKPIPK